MKLLQTLLSVLQNRSTILCNTAAGTHANGAVSFTAATAIDQKYCFGALTSNAGEIALAGSGLSTRAIGVISDEADQAGDYVNTSIIGATGSTMKVTAGGAIAVGDMLTSDADSLAVDVAEQSAGTYFVYGIALTPAAAGELVEFAPIAGATQTVA